MHVLTRASLLPPNRPAEPAPPPATVRAASRLWMLAIVAGLGEALVTAYDLTSDGSTAREVTGLLAVRLVVFVAAYVLVQLTRGGNPWARGTGTLLLGTVGMIALVLSPIPHLVTHGLGEVSNATAIGLLLAAARVVELFAVATAMVLLFTPRSNAYFRHPHGDPALSSRNS